MQDPHNLLEFIRMDPEGKMAQGIAGTQLISLLRQVEDFLREIDQSLDTLSADEKDTGATRAGLEHLRDSLIEFHHFSWDYFEFITESDCGNLPNQTRALQKIQNELLALRPLVEQRRSSELLSFLNAADALAIDFIAKCGLREGSRYANQSVTNGLQRFLVFFEENVQINQRKLAYPRVPSISVPLSTWRSPWLWLGLGHEVGHYVYQNLENPIEQTSLKIALQEAIVKIVFGKQAQTLWGEWVEEVFADLYGVLILGPSYTESLICQIFLAHLPDSAPLLANDHDHPPIFLRPFLHFEILRQSSQRRADNGGTGLHQEIDRLEALWKSICNLLIPEEQRAAGQDAFAYWGQQQIKGSRLRAQTCLRDHIPAIAPKLLDIVAYFKDVHYYTAELHDAVVKTAKDLAHATPFDQLSPPDVLQAELPTLALPVAWYTWTELTGDRGGRSDALNNLCQWIKHVAQGTREGSYQPHHASVQQIPNVTHLINARPNRQQGKAFQKLLADVKALQDVQATVATKSGCKLTENLLNVDFSVQNAQLGNGGCSVGTHSCCCPD